MHKADYHKSFSHKLEISFIISLSLFLALFYFYPRFESLFTAISKDTTPDFVIMAIPRTIQPLKKMTAIPILPVVPVESDEEILLNKIDVQKQQDEKSSDTLLVLYYPALKYQNLFEPFDSSYMRVFENKDSLYQYKEYLAKRLEKMDFVGISIFPSPELERELNRAMGRLPVVGITIPINIGSLFGGASGHSYPEGKSKILSVKNIIAAHEKFDVLESLWLNGPQTIFELYESDSLNKKNTYGSLQQSLDDLIINGLVERTKTSGGDYKFKPVYSHKTMIRIVAAFRYSTSAEQKVECEILSDVLQQLLDFN